MAARWEQPFPAVLTQEHPFTLPSGEDVQVAMMDPGTYRETVYAETQGWQAAVPAGTAGSAGRGRATARDAADAGRRRAERAGLGVTEIAFASSGPAEPPIELTIDRPYLVRITDGRTGWPLFFAHITDPRSEQ